MNNWNSNWKKLLGFRNMQEKIEKYVFLSFFSVRSDGLPSPNSTCDALFPGRTGHPKGTLRSPAANSDLFERVEGAFRCKKYLVPSDSQSLTLTVWHTIRPNGKNPQKVRFKNSWNWRGHSYASQSLTLTVWHHQPIPFVVLGQTRLLQFNNAL